MLKGRDIVCFANDWDNDPQSKKHILRRLARKNRVLWVESLGNRAPRLQGRDLRRIAHKVRRFARDWLTPDLPEPEPNLYLHTPLALPLFGLPGAQELNAELVGTSVRAAMARLGFRRPITYTFVPASACVVGKLGEERIVYHCVDDFGSFDGAGAAIVRQEEALCRRADLVIACSEPLRASRIRWNPRTVLVRHGVEHEHFARALDQDLREPDALAAIPHPRIGFHGLIAEWIDVGLLCELARAMPEAHLVLLGQATRPLPELAALPNVHLLGRRPYAELPAYCKGFDVALLPFVIDPLTEASNPLKLREYLAAGLPVVAADIPEARTLAPLVRVARTRESFIAQVRAALEEAGPRPERSSAVASEGWDAKAEQIGRLLGDDPQELLRLAALEPFCAPMTTVQTGPAVAWSRHE